MRQAHAAALLGALTLALALPVAAGARSEAALDIRGNWSMPAAVGAAKYPQIWSIVTENLKTGAWHGHIKGNPTYLLWGTVSGHTLVIHSRYGGYQSHGKGTLVTSGARWRVVGGTFSDTNHVTGTFTGLRLSKTPTG